MASWSDLSTRQKVALALGVSAGAAVLCVFYAKYRSGQAPSSTESDEDTEELRMKISQSAVKPLSAGEDEAIGRLSKRTSTRIELSQVIDSDGRQELTIRGSPAQVRHAQELLPGILQDDAVIEVELHLPARSVCRIIGKGGQRIREMSKTSGANIQCERQPDNCLDLARCITITGSLKQVEDAKALIQKVVEDDAAIWKNPAVSSNFRSHKKTIISVKKKDKPPPAAKEGATPSTGSPDSFHTADSPEGRMGEESEPRNLANATFNVYKFEVPSPDFNFRAGEYVEICVSASENPKHFWIQILGSRASQLDKLTTEMSDFYLRQKQEEMAKIQNGDIVAAPYHDDGFWYRAEVLGLPENDQVDLYYVDYGDNWACPKGHLFPLRSDFLSLPFQAVECGLAYVLPNGEKWSSEALDTFDTLVHCAKWKPLLAKIVSFPSPEVSHFQIQLYDPSRDPMLDIGQELIRLGLAVEQRKSPVKSDDDETIVSRLLAEVTSMSEMPEPTSFAKLQEEEPRLESDESIEVTRADVNRSPELQLANASSPPPLLQTSTTADSLEMSLSKICLGSGEDPAAATSSSSPNSDKSATSSSPTSDKSATSDNSATPSRQSASVDSSFSSLTTSTDCSTCTASEVGSPVSSMEDSSINSLRGCFYYLEDEVSTSSVFDDSKEVITISSDSEEESGVLKGGAKPAATKPETLNSSSDDVILVEPNEA